jgi:hypothetical protein
MYLIVTGGCRSWCGAVFSFCLHQNKARATGYRGGNTVAKGSRLEYGVVNDTAGRMLERAGAVGE